MTEKKVRELFKNTGFEFNERIRKSTALYWFRKGCEAMENELKNCENCGADGSSCESCSRAIWARGTQEGKDNWIPLEKQRSE